MTVWQMNGWLQVVVWILAGVCLALGATIAVMAAWRVARRRARTAPPLGRRALGWNLLGWELLAGALICISVFPFIAAPALKIILIVAISVAEFLFVYVRAYAEGLRNRERQAGEPPRPGGEDGRPTAP